MVSKWTWPVLFAATISMAAGAPAHARSHATGSSVPAIVSRALPAVVSIVTRQIEQDQFNQPVPTRGRGSGLIVDPRGYVLTNNHVVEGAEEIKVTLPLTIYLLSGWLQRRYPGLDLLSHDAGHLWETLFGWRGNSHLNPLHLLSGVLIGGGFIVLAQAWPVLYVAQQRRRIATTGPYAYVRHPQYAAFILIMLGFLLQWPTLLTLAMFPVLTWAYVRLARNEEQEARSAFGEAYARYAATTPAFVPYLIGRAVPRKS